MMIYERFWRPEMEFTIEEAYAFIEENAPDSFADPAAREDFQRKVNERFPVRPELAAHLASKKP